jgi:hypothetical protein
MPGMLTELGVAGKLLLRTVGRRLRSEIEAAPDLDAFTTSMQRSLDAVASEHVRDSAWLTMEGSEVPWRDSGLLLEPGDEVSYFFEGRVYANRMLDIYVNPALNLWCKIGQDGTVFRGTRNSHSFRADQAGELRFGNYFPNDWIDSQGTRKQDDSVYASISGSVRILVIRWLGTAEQGVCALLAADQANSSVADELGRILQGDTTPRGWTYLWHLGPSEIYRDQSTHDDKACIHCHTSGDVGILQKAVDLPLDPSTEISWRWCIDQLPITLREDTVPSHDYLSIAIEFENGRDITYYWSSSLPVGTGYDCPLPNWKGKEFHVVVRSGRSELGEWHNERRNLYEDYRQYMGEPPARVVKIWLIANSIFQRGVGECDYADILLHHDSGQREVLSNGAGHVRR